MLARGRKCSGQEGRSRWEWSAGHEPDTDSHTCSQPDPYELGHSHQAPFTDLATATDPALEETSGYPIADCSRPLATAPAPSDPVLLHPATHLQLAQQHLHPRASLPLSHHNTGPSCSPRAVSALTGQPQTSAVQCKEEGDDVSTLSSMLLPRVLRQQRVQDHGRGEQSWRRS